jgi:putative NADH-flavin reductase
MQRRLHLHLPHILLLLLFLKTTAIANSTMKVFVAGATGATGKYVVQQLLSKGESVVAVARSREKLEGLLPKGDYGDRLTVHEGTLLDWTDDELKDYTKDCSAVVSCLGHSMTVGGIWGAPYKLVTEATQRLTTAMPSTAHFILMGSEGVSIPEDPERSFTDRFTLGFLRTLIPPHADNEQAAAYLEDHKEMNWSVVRPTNLVDAKEATGEYSLQDSPSGDLFGSDTVSRANVAHFIVELITNPKMWEQYKHKMPVMKPPKDKQELEKEEL